MTSDPKLQVFLEDLAAVYSKHGIQLDIPGPITFSPLQTDYDFLAFDEYDRLTFVREDRRNIRYEWDEDGYEQNLLKAVAPITRTAHGRMAAAALVAALRREG